MSVAAVLTVAVLCLCAAHPPCVQYAGFTVTPLLGSVITAARGPGETEWGLLSSSLFTIPAYVLFALALFGIVLLQFCFEDVPPAAKAPPTLPSADATESASAPLTAVSPMHNSEGNKHDGSAVALPTSARSSALGKSVIAYDMDSLKRGEWGVD